MPAFEIPLDRFSIRSRLLILIALTTVVSLAVGLIGLVQGNRSERAFNAVFEHQVVSTGYVRDVDVSYGTVSSAATKFADGTVGKDEALKEILQAKGEVLDVWPRLTALQQLDTDRATAVQLAAAIKRTDGDIDGFVTTIQAGDRARTRALLGPWNGRREELQRQLSDFYERLQSETGTELYGLTQAFAKGRQSQIYILMAGVCGSLLIGWTVFVTVNRSVARIRGQLHELAAGDADLTKRIPTGNSDEVGQIAVEVNLLMDKLLALVKRVQESGIQVTSSSTQLSASSKELEATLTEQVAATNQVVSSAKEISATARTLVGTMTEVSAMSQEAGSSAGSGQAGLDRMRQTMEKMEAASAAIADKLAAINAKVANITTVVTTINKVADQTNLLSLNASIEAAKAGEFGQGFAVVAREIRRLADQTAVATLDIEQMVSEMQSTVSSGVMGMEKFAQEVQGGVGEVKDISAEMGRIINQVKALGPRFESVTEGMESQSIGAQQISDAMVQLSEATRDTAASQREAVQAIKQLERAAQMLHREVSSFKVSTSSTPQARSTSPEPARGAAVTAAV